MIAGLAILNYAVLAICLAAMLAVGIWAGRGQQTSDEFFLANRSLSLWPLGLSLAVAGLAAVYYCSAANEAYWVGLKFLLVPALVWVALPIVFWCIIPLYGNLELDSVFEYLELRFDPTTRGAAAGIYVAGMVLWLGGVLVLPLYALQLGIGLSLVGLGLLVTVGVVTTAYTYLGGMKAAVFTDVLQAILMAIGLLLLIYFVAGCLDPGLGRIWEVAEKLGRTSIVDATLDPSAKWSVWAAVPYLALMPIFFFVADQTTLQRLLAARDDQDMTLAYLLGSLLFGLMVPTVMYLGMGLLAVYHDHAQSEIPPRWVVNSVRDQQTGRLLIGSDTVINADTIGELVARKWVLDPNIDQPFADAGELVNARGEVIIDRLATRKTRKQDGERILRNGHDELLARFVKHHLPLGLAGVVLSALVAAAMATIDSGIISLSTLIVIDFHRRFGWAEQWLAEQCGKSPDELNRTDELRLARPTVLILGGAVIVVSVVVAATGGGVGFLLGVMNLFAGPLLGVFLLGLFTRRTTSRAALAALVLGGLTVLWATLGHYLAATPLWPFEGPLGPFWPLLFGLAATLLVGYLGSFFVGDSKSRDELSGLVAGLGRWGALMEVEHEKEEEIYWIETDEKESPWS